MGRKRKHIDYRQYYKEYYGIEFGENMIVHHIDFDRTNNNIDNLILMPKELHAKYHWYVSALGGTGTGVLNINCKLDGTPFCHSSDLRGLADALDDLSDWSRTKYQMDMMKYQGVRWDEVVRY